jgi:ribosomal protein S25
MKTEKTLSLKKTEEHKNKKSKKLNQDIIDQAINCSKEFMNKITDSLESTNETLKVKGNG